MKFGNGSELDISVAGEGGQVVENQRGTFSDRFFGRQASQARDAWDGDADAALGLPGAWVVSAEIRLAEPINESHPETAWVVVPTVDVVLAAISEVPVWKLAPSFDRLLPTVWLVEALGASDVLIAGASAIVPLGSDSAAAEVASALATHAPPARWRKPAHLPDLAHPKALAPIQVRGTALNQLEAAMWRASATTAWVAIASTVGTPSTGSAKIDVEYFGLQRVSHEIDRAGIAVTSDDASLALEMFTWSTSPDSVDQLLAVQQVCSLYREVAPWYSTADVFDAAQSVFMTLRRDAVAEALKERRAARAVAIEAAQRTSEHVAALSRSTAERVVGTLLAVVGVLVAKTTKTITPEQAQDLHWLLVVALVALAAWTIFIEGPPLTAPLSELEEDLPEIAKLLRPRERDEILKLHAIQGARHRARLIRWCAPIVFGLSAVAASIIS